MKIIIIEEIRFRQRVVKYATKHNNNAKAARRYHTSHQQVQRWRKRYDGMVSRWLIRVEGPTLILTSIHRRN